MASLWARDASKPEQPVTTGNKYATATNVAQVTVFISPLRVSKKPAYTSAGGSTVPPRTIVH